MTELLGMFGRLHPLVLHLPIGMLATLALLEVAALFARIETPRRVVTLLAAVTALAAVASAATGWVLAEEGGWGELVLERHRKLGLAVAAGSVAAALVHAASGGGARIALLRAYRALLFVTAALLVPAGHLGATMTHGADYLEGPREATPRTVPAASVDPVGAGPASADAAGAAQADDPTETAPVDPPVAAAATSTFGDRIAPILAARCTGCHGETKRKGKLALHDVASIEKGGVLGPVLVPGRPEESEIVYRLRLPLDDEEHMPPEGKPQPSEDEIRSIEAWIEAGAPFEGTLDLGPPPAAVDEPAAGAQDQAVEATPPRSPAPPDPAALAALERELVHVELLDPAAGTVWVDFSAVAAHTDDALVERLLAPLTGNVAQLSLARSRTGATTLALCARMPRLARLDLRATQVNDAALAALADHPALAELVLAQTSLSEAAVDTLLALPALRRVFLWESGVGADGLERLRRERPDLAVEAGDSPDAAALEVEPELALSGDRPPPGSQAGDGDRLAPVNAICPVSGNPVDPRYRVVHDGRVFGFCCPNCPKTFWEDPEACLADLK